MSSGRFIVRLSPALHAELKTRAKALAMSLNDLCCRRLALPTTQESLPTWLVEPVTALAEIGGASLAGIVIFGSWARQDAHDESDVDVLVVLNHGAKITRKLYAQWEARSPERSKVEPHFVQLPDLKSRVSGLWAEVAMDGIVIVDRDFLVQHYLRHIRHLIASGQLLAKRVHGQNYWIHQGVA